MSDKTRAIEHTQACTTMDDVRRHIDALDDVLVPLLVTRGGYMTQAARIKQHDSQVRDEERMKPSWRACVRVLKKRAASPT